MKKLVLVLLFISSNLNLFAQKKIKNIPKDSSINSITTMKVEIWSDIMCPFCYIGKRKLEAALDSFKHKEKIEIIWKSYQLDPTIQYTPGKDVYSYLAERKGMSVAQSKSLHENVVEMAKKSGLTYNFDKAIINNSFNAHRVIQFAKTKNLGDKMEERLFLAYFTEGKNVGDFNTLAELGNEIGLNKEEVLKVLNDGLYRDEVNKDIREANEIGVRGVPFFVVNRKYGISGAQDSEVFLETLNKSYEEWAKENNVSELEIKEGAVCTPSGECK